MRKGGGRTDVTLRYVLGLQRTEVWKLGRKKGEKMWEEDGVIWGGEKPETGETDGKKVMQDEKWKSVNLEDAIEDVIADLRRHGW